MRSIFACLLFSCCLLTFSLTAQAQTIHTVQKGDSLWKIASLYSLSVDELKKLNQLTSDTIFLNQQLKVRHSSKQVEYRTIMQGGKKVQVPVFTPPVAQETAPPTTLTNQVLSIAQKQLGVPYLWAGSTPQGFDCSGYLYYVYKQAGLSITRMDTIGFYNRAKVVQTPQPGDIVFFANTYRSGISHAGIYLGNDLFIHAGSTGIDIANYKGAYWKDHFVDFRRLY